jgi:hypothetical protein
MEFEQVRFLAPNNQWTHLNLTRIHRVDRCTRKP